MDELPDTADIPNNSNPFGAESDVDVELLEIRQREEIKRQDDLKAKSIEEGDKKRERIMKGKQEFEEALK